MSYMKLNLTVFEKQNIIDKNLSHLEYENSVFSDRNHFEQYTSCINQYIIIDSTVISTGDLEILNPFVLKSKSAKLLCDE